MLGVLLPELSRFWRALGGVDGSDPESGPAALRQSRSRGVGVATGWIGEGSARRDRLGARDGWYRTCWIDPLGKWKEQIRARVPAGSSPSRPELAGGTGASRGLHGCAAQFVEVEVVEARGGLAAGEVDGRVEFVLDDERVAAERDERWREHRTHELPDACP